MKKEHTSIEQRIINSRKHLKNLMINCGFLGVIMTIVIYCIAEMIRVGLPMNHSQWTLLSFLLCGITCLALITLRVANYVQIITTTNLEIYRDLLRMEYILSSIRVIKGDDLPDELVNDILNTNEKPTIH